MPHLHRPHRIPRALSTQTPRLRRHPCLDTPSRTLWRLALHRPSATRRPDAGPRHTRTHAPTPTHAAALTHQHCHLHAGTTHARTQPDTRRGNLQPAPAVTPCRGTTHPRTHTAAPTHQHHPSGSSGGTSGAAVGRPTGAQHSRHSYSVAADSSQPAGPSNNKQGSGGGRRSGGRPPYAAEALSGGSIGICYRTRTTVYGRTVQHSTGVCTRVVATGMQQDTCHLYRPIDRLTIPAKKDICPE